MISVISGSCSRRLERTEAEHVVDDGVDDAQLVLARHGQVLLGDQLVDELADALAHLLGRRAVGASRQLVDEPLVHLAAQLRVQVAAARLGQRAAAQAGAVEQRRLPRRRPSPRRPRRCGSSAGGPGAGAAPARRRGGRRRRRSRGGSATSGARPGLVLRASAAGCGGGAGHPGGAAGAWRTCQPVGRGGPTGRWLAGPVSGAAAAGARHAAAAGHARRRRRPGAGARRLLQPCAAPGRVATSIRATPISVRRFVAKAIDRRSRPRAVPATILSRRRDREPRAAAATPLHGSPTSRLRTVTGTAHCRCAAVFLTA